MNFMNIIFTLLILLYKNYKEEFIYIYNLKKHRMILYLNNKLKDITLAFINFNLNYLIQENRSNMYVMALTYILTC